MSYDKLMAGLSEALSENEIARLAADRSSAREPPGERDEAWFLDGTTPASAKPRKE